MCLHVSISPVVCGQMGPNYMWWLSVHMNCELILICYSLRWLVWVFLWMGELTRSRNSVDRDGTETCSCKHQNYKLHLLIWKFSTWIMDRRFYGQFRILHEVKIFLWLKFSVSILSVWVVLSSLIAAHIEK